MGRFSSGFIVSLALHGLFLGTAAGLGAIGTSLAMATDGSQIIPVRLSFGAFETVGLSGPLLPQAPPAAALGPSPAAQAPAMPEIVPPLPEVFAAVPEIARAEIPPQQITPHFLPIPEPESEEPAPETQNIADSPAPEAESQPPPAPREPEPEPVPPAAVSPAAPAPSSRPDPAPTSPVVPAAQNQTQIADAGTEAPSAGGSGSGGLGAEGGQSGPLGGDYELGQADGPGLVNFVQPSYPPSARRQGLEGRVLLRVLVGADGKALEVQVLEASHNVFVDPAKTAAERSTYRPLQQNGRALQAWVRLPLNFRLN